MFVIEILPWNDVHRLVRQCPPGEDDGSCNEELDDCVRPEPTLSWQEQIRGDKKMRILISISLNDKAADYAKVIKRTLPSCECSQVTGDERTEWEEDKETNGAKNGMSFDLEVEANQLAGRELDGFCVDHVEEV